MCVCVIEWESESWRDDKKEQQIWIQALHNPNWCTEMFDIPVFQLSPQEGGQSGRRGRARTEYGGEEDCRTPRRSRVGQ